MAGDDDTIKHLTLGRADLIRKRSELNAMITSMSRMIVELGGSLENAPPTAREAILSALPADGGTMSMSEIVARAHDLGTTAQADPIRSLLTKMFKSGVLERPSHGQYRIVVNDRVNQC